MVPPTRPYNTNVPCSDLGAGGWNQSIEREGKNPTLPKVLDSEHSEVVMKSFLAGGTFLTFFFFKRG